MARNYDVAIVTGFIGSKGMDGLEDSLKQKIHPRSSTIIGSVPINKAFHDPEEIVKSVDEDLDKLDSNEIVLIGHSDGALIALVVACRRKLNGVTKLFLIDGPLSPDYEITPTIMLHKLFARHYDYRPFLAKECESSLRDLDTSKIVTIGSRHDRVVTPGAKTLSGKFKNKFMEHNGDISPDDFAGENGVNVLLPEYYRGHSMNKRIEVVTEVIKVALNKTQPQIISRPELP